MSTFSTFDSTVNSFYLAFYGRPADPAGLKFWSEQLANNDGNLGAITQAFATSEEAQVRFGTDSVSDRIGEIYQQLFNHTPDAEGLAYWTGVIEQGNASMADVAIAILNGARGSDATLAQLRQQAVDAFTAQVEADGTQYSGYASIEAARILVRAVTADATAADLDALVKAAVSFADTATRTPQVVEAIAVNTTLLALFDTARGAMEPVALAKALADIAKAAAGDPAALESLLRGGGMDQVLRVMPANATLKDLVDALSKGGLPSAIEVVYPTAPTEPGTPSPPSPTFNLTLSFDTVKQGDFDLDLKDNITNQSTADVTFSYVGRDLRPGQYFEYSLDGVNYTDQNIVTAPATNTVVLKDVQLGDLQVTTIYVRATDPSGAHTTPFVQEIVYDGFVTQPLVALTNDTFHEELGSNVDLVTSDGELDVSNVEEGADIEYAVIKQQPQKIVVPFGSTTEFDLPPLNAIWTEAPEYEQGLNTVWVRVTDIAGNQSFRKFEFTLDSEKPATPVIELHDNAGGSNGTQVNISELESGPHSAWEYSLDGGGEWITGQGKDDLTGTATLDVLGTGTKSVLVRQYDIAGNVSLETAPLEFTVPEQPFLELTFHSQGIGVNTNVEGKMVITNETQSIELATTGNAADGTLNVGAQTTQLSGTIGVKPSSGAVIEDGNNITYLLGTDVGNMLSGNYLFGFGGDDQLFGTIGDDVFAGGAGGDLIVTNGGNDLILIKDASESYMGIPSNNGNTYDVVQANGSGNVIFDFGTDVTQVFSGALAWNPSSPIEETYLAMTTAYTAAASNTENAAVLMSIGINRQSFLVVDNGDGIIDANDIVVSIIGVGSVSANSDGNVEFLSTPN